MKGSFQYHKTHPESKIHVNWSNKLGLRLLKAWEGRGMLPGYIYVNSDSEPVSIYMYRVQGTCIHISIKYKEPVSIYVQSARNLYPYMYRVQGTCIHICIEYKEPVSIYVQSTSNQYPYMYRVQVTSIHICIEYKEPVSIYVQSTRNLYQINVQNTKNLHLYMYTVQSTKNIYPFEKNKFLLSVCKDIMIRKMDKLFLSYSVLCICIHIH